MKLSKGIVASAILIFLAVIGCQDGSGPFNPESGSNVSGSSLALQNSAVGNYVWLDSDADGIQDPDEAGMGDVTVNLYDCDENMLESMVTDEEGHYIFVELEAGEYMLGFELPDGYMFSPQDQGDDDELDSDVDPETGMTVCFELGEEAEDVSRDAGLYMAEEEGCTYGKGFWKNHAGMGPQDDLVTELLPLWLGDEDGENSMYVETAEMAYDILGQHAYGHPSNGITKLYAHLLTAKLNVANEADDEDIADVIEEADGFLAENGWEDWDDLSQDDREMVNEWKGTLEDYNEGEIGPGNCHDEGIY
jgi:hypothetical protein